MAKIYALKSKLKRQDMEDMRSLLSAWYGSEQAYLEVAEHAKVPTMAAGDIAADILSQVAGADAGKFIELDECFADIMGHPLNKFTKLNSLKHGVAYIEVRHPAWMVELERLKPQLIARINEHCNRKICVDLRFMPGGRS